MAFRDSETWLRNFKFCTWKTIQAMSDSFATCWRQNALSAKSFTFVMRKNLPRRSSGNVSMSSIRLFIAWIRRIYSAANSA